jgi:hypothetical protein
MNTVPKPSAEALARAFAEHVPVRMGAPVAARDGGTVYCRDLAAAAEGDPADWWWSTALYGGRVVDIRSPTDRGIYIEGVGDVPPSEWTRVDAALAAAPREADRHTADGEADRRIAGELAMRISDAHVRSAVLTIVDGWAAVAEDPPIDASPEDGSLHNMLGSDMRGRVLIVTCPSTRRRYAHRVPVTLTTARDARRWVMALPAGAPDPEVET